MTDNELLKLLKDNSDDFISGERLSELFSTSRTAVWKHIKNLKEKGYEIESVTNKGYRLKESDVLNADEIKALLNTDILAKNIRIYDSVDSTNNEAKRSSECDGGTLFVADKQTKGKGRVGKEWKSEKNEGLYMSLLIKPNIPPKNVSALTLVVGLAVVKALNKLTDKRAYIKWPNDIVMNKKKICGILCEMSAEINRTEYAVCGIGINLNNAEFNDEIKNIATSVLKETGIKLKRNTVIAEVMNCFEPLYREYLKNGMTNIIEDYKNNCITLGKDVVIIKNGEKTEAKAVDVNTEGELIIEIDGVLSCVSSGEVSVRGIFGYV